ncbi:MAG: UDP-N-acetylmuramoyl-L-alanine--D-glutamate ligase [Acidobacteria bacterium]|nr:MAG: UDP-N-acetylmuramoyl-L-alanine--D-glutamate ligase [Acidobacteriota bacterium]PYQ22429.1 MAG: UDP-N-acetylmuramoyl-L-alanine--D-glutamate ligase [Acidobacteriota bacterium]
MELAGKNAVVVGMARSGVAAAELLLRRGARVVATDRKPAAELPPPVVSLREKGARLELGAHVPGTFTAAELVVVSPGVPWDLPELVSARRAGAEVIAELELGFRCLAGTVAAVTGTKGKSTTTAALGAMLKQAGRDVRVGGNIGEAVTGLVEGSTAETLFVLEVSSFQLEGTESFHPRVAVFLNLSADHLDRHPSFEDYARAKARIFRNQTEADWAVVNADDPAVLALAREGRARRLHFHLHPDAPPPEDRGPAAFFAAGEARLERGGATESLFTLAQVRLPGAHLAGDLLAAAAAARLLGAPAGEVSAAVGSFTGVEHVLERVADIGGVAFFNDSKATNVDAARKGIEAFAGPLLVIMGGRYKGGDFHELAGALAARGKAVLAIGEARERIAEALGSSLPVIRCGGLGEAVAKAWAEAKPGDTVLLAPACSSFDMFEDYAARGRAFKEEVRRLEPREPAGPTGARR